MANRGERLAAERRKKAKIRKMMKETWCCPTGVRLDKNEKFVGRMAHTPHPCSGMCCGNPRRHYKGAGRLTRQEIKELAKERVE